MNLARKIKKKAGMLLHFDSYLRMEEKRLEYSIKHDDLIKEALSSTRPGVSEERYCDHEIIVSLTTYGDRLYSVAPAIESIMQGSVKPNRIVLNLGEELKGKTLPVAVQNQQRRGLEVYYGRDIRSYKKLVPTLERYPDAAIITIDDDAVYHYDLVEKLLLSHIEMPGLIIANRVHRIRLGKSGRPMGYMDWEQGANPDDVSFLNFSTGCGGTLYPPHRLPEATLDADVFMDICPYADDVWFYCMALLNGIMTKKCYTHDGRGDEFIMNEDVQDMGLCRINTSKRGKRCENDNQLEAVFDKYDLWGKLKE